MKKPRICGYKCSLDNIAWKRDGGRERRKHTQSRMKELEEEIVEAEC